jgi:hydrogenase maturation protease
MVIGLGTPERGDDAAGLEAARLLAPLAPAGTRVLALPGQTAELLDLWTQAPLAVVIDAVVSGAAPGTIHRVDGRNGRLRGASYRRSTHDIGLADIVALGRALDRLPQRLVIVGIEVQSCSVGAGLSALVRRGVRQAVGAVLTELATPENVAPG